MAEAIYKAAIDYTLEALVDTLNRGFEGYVVNVQFSRTSLLSVLMRDSVDLGLSRVAEVDGKPVAIGLIARRGWTARLAAMGVATECRGQGVGKGLLADLVKTLTEQRLRTLILEVVEQNEPAVKLYQQAGFETIRRLVSLNRDDSEKPKRATPESAALVAGDVATVAGKLTADHLADLPWQLSGTNLMVDGPPACAYQFEGGTIVISDPSKPTISVRSIFVAPENRGKGYGTQMVGALMAHYPGKKWVIPALCPEELGPIFIRNGFQLGELSQLQMKRTL